MPRARPKTRNVEDIRHLKNVNFRVDKGFAKSLKLFCVKHEISMQEFIKQAVEEKRKSMKSKK